MSILKILFFMKKLAYLVAVLLVLLSFSACTTYRKTIKETNVRVEFNSSDFELSEQVSASANSTKIFYIDFQRIFISKEGSIEGSAGINVANIPVIGNVISDRTANYALYELLKENPGYDVILYPQYEIKTVKPALGLGFLTTYTTVTVKARLGRLK
jgi:hypothetical protein